MSNVAVFNPSQVPAFAKKGELSAIAKALAGGGGGGTKRISIKGGVFRLMADGKQVASIDERYLDVVVVNAAPKISRTFYANAYDPDTPAGPDCWSADGERPAFEVQNPQADTCANCPKNVKGSGNGEARACRFSQRLAVVLANDIEGDVLQLTLPATSIFGKENGDDRPLQAYSRWLVAQGIGPDMVVTRMKFDTKAESPKLFFKPMRWLTDDEHDTCVKQGQSDVATRAITMTVAQVTTYNPNLRLILKVRRRRPRLKPRSRTRKWRSLKSARKRKLLPRLRRKSWPRLLPTGILTTNHFGGKAGRI